MSGEIYSACIKPAKQLELMEAYSQTLAKKNEVKMNDRLKMTVRKKPLARSMVTTIYSSVYANAH